MLQETCIKQVKNVQLWGQGFQPSKRLCCYRKMGEKTPLNRQKNDRENRDKIETKTVQKADRSNEKQNRQKPILKKRTETVPKTDRLVELVLLLLRTPLKVTIQKISNNVLHKSVYADCYKLNNQLRKIYLNKNFIPASINNITSKIGSP